MIGKENDKQGFIVLVVIAVIVSMSLYGTSKKCNATCMEQWINHHRTEPSDCVLWKVKLCSLFKSPPCDQQIRITLMEWEDFYKGNFIYEAFSSDIKDSYAVVSIGDLKLLQTKQPRHLLNDDEIEHSTYILDDFQTKDISSDTEFIQRLKFGHLKLCNDKRKNKDIREKVVLEKRSTIFSVHDIVTGHFIEKDMNVVRLLLFARQNTNCSMLLKEALIFMTIVNFIPGTYDFSNKHLHPNLSIIQHFNLENMYLTEDGQSFMKNWIYLRFPFYVIYLFILVKIWHFTGKMFEANPFYRYTHSTFSTYVCNPLLISANSPFTDIIRTYFLERAWFRKILLICSGYFITMTIVFLFSITTHMINFHQVLDVSVLFHVPLFILCVTECVVKCINQRIKWLPEPFEASALSILISPTPLCLILRFVNISNLLCRNQNVNAGMMFLSNIMYWAFRAFVCFFYLIFMCFTINYFLQFFVNIYHQYAEWMFSMQIWIPLIFLCISYLRDVCYEYSGVFRQCLQYVVRLIKDNEYINTENVAILSDGESTCCFVLKNNNCEINSKVMLFYHHGVVHVTSKFYYEIRELLCEVLGSSLCIKLIVINELKSICFRMFPVIITIVVINTSNLSLDKFEPVQKFLVSSILFQSYSRLFLKRISPKIDIDTNPYFKTKLQELIRQRKEEFTVTHLSKRKTFLHMIPGEMIIITGIMFCVICYIVFISHTEQDPFQILPTISKFSGFLNTSRISIFFHIVVFAIFCIHLVLISRGF